MYRPADRHTAAFTAEMREQGFTVDWDGDGSAAIMVELP